ncbi:MAG: RNA polymerase sigma factor [Planctomycetota bacterium]
MPDKDEKNIDQILLWRAIHKKDRKAITILYTKYYLHVKYFIASHINLSADADDLTQNVFVEILKGKGNYNIHQDPWAHILGIAENIICRYYHENMKLIKTVPIELVNDIAV